MLLVIGLFVLLTAPVWIGMGRMAWRIWRHNEEMVPGGSMSHQMFDRTKDRRRKKARG